MITIGELARYAGVTIKAVRHYHRRGLIAEPQRDSSGYRRYSAADAIMLVKIKTLADAGVPLARIAELLVAEPEPFAIAIAQIDHDLEERAERIKLARERIAQLRAGDGLFVSDEVAHFLDRLHQLGISRRAVEMERDAWILVQAVSPTEAAIWLADKVEAMSDPEFRSIYVQYDSAFDWAPDDPRLSELADRSQRWMAERHRMAQRSKRPTQQPAIAQLVVTSLGMSSPAWKRLGEIASKNVMNPQGEATAEAAGRVPPATAEDFIARAPGDDTVAALAERSCLTPDA